MTDELALDLQYALDALPYQSELAGLSLDEAALSALQRLSDLLGADPRDELWDEQALNTHPTWAEAHVLARKALALMPGGE